MCRRNHLYHRLLCVISLISVAGQAEVTFDNSLGQPITADTLSGEIIIPEGRGTLVGSNLFHSFQDFNINTGESTTFTGQSPVENILGRVTGDNASLIDGLLRTRFDNSNPNLFLMNPNGILFGPYASLDVQGSFHVTTADYLRLGDDGFFHADLNKKTTLSVASIEAFGFLGENPGTIEFQGSGSIVLQGVFEREGIDFKGIKVPEGKTLSIIGGEIQVSSGEFDTGVRKVQLESRLQAPGGRINLASVNSQGEVKLVDNDIMLEGFEQLGNIQIDSVNSEFATKLDTSGEGAGSIYIRGKQFTSDHAVIVTDTLGEQSGGIVDIEVNDLLSIRNGAKILSRTNTGAKGADIDLKANDIVIEGLANSDSLTGIDVDTLGKGRAGNIVITVNNLLLKDKAIVRNKSGNFESRSIQSNQGHGGDVSIYATNSVTVMTSSQIASQTNSEGDAGNIVIEAPDILISEVSGEAMSGGVSASTFGNGNAGDILITTDRLSLENGGRITSSGGGFFLQDGRFTLGSKGAPGRIVIDASEFVSMLDRDAMLPVFINEITNINRGESVGGKIFITTPILTVNDGSRISSFTQDRGTGGNVEINVDWLNIKGGRIDVATEYEGNAGAIVVDALNGINLSDGAVLLANSENPVPGGLETVQFGTAGRISISTSVLTLDNSFIVATTETNGDGGDVSINAREIKINNGGAILADTFGSGKGGNVTIDAEDIVLKGVFEDGTSSQFSTSAQGMLKGDGDGGNLLVKTNTLQLLNGARINANTEGFGTGGNIKVEANEINVTGRGGNIRSAIASNSNQGSSGDAGNIVLTVDSLKLGDGGQITVETIQADAGNINLDVGHLLQLNNDSAITTSAAVVNDQGTGNGGNINIKSGETNSTFVVLNNGSQIIAQANEGSGGNINISASSLFKSPNSIIDASSQFGQSGTVVIDSPDTNVIEGALILPGSFLDASALLSQRCAARGGKRSSSFIVKPLEGIQPAPDDYLSGFYTNTAATAADSSQQKPVNNAFPLDMAVGGNSILCL
ncbi:MAG: filamentous hemagglutinin N-terminal domain-containing protein [Methylococcales bacterium]